MLDINDFLKKIKSDTTITKDDEKISYFNRLIDELYDIAEKYNNYSFMNDQFSRQITATKYASESKCLHRGFYCPSPIYDIVVGGCKRGRMINKPSKASKEYYQYCFDNDQQLICINQFTEANLISPYTTEFIIRTDNLEYGITYHNIHKNIDYLVKCEYENSKIKNYTLACYLSGMPKDTMSLQYEEYEYANNLLSKAVMYPGIVPKYNLYENTKFEFLYDSNDNIAEYIAKSDYQGQPIENRYKVRG